MLFIYRCPPTGQPVPGFSRRVEGKPYLCAGYLPDVLAGPLCESAHGRCLGSEGWHRAALVRGLGRRSGGSLGEAGNGSIGFN